MFVGNDYVWPHVSHRLARALRQRQRRRASLGENFLPFGTRTIRELLDEIRRLRRDAVLLSLIGQDEVDFNRAFGRAGLSRDVLRLSSVMAENELLGIGAENTENLFVTAGYFAALDTDANLAFKERYHGRFGQRAPTLNTFGQSTYEGVHFLASVFAAEQHEPASWAHQGQRALPYPVRATSNKPARARAACRSILRRPMATASASIAGFDEGPQATRAVPIVPRPEFAFPGKQTD